MNRAILKRESVLPGQEGNAMAAVEAEPAGWRDGRSARLCVVPAA